MSDNGQTNKAKGIVDIVFLVDATGSMQPCIDALKANISTFIDTLTSKGPNNDNPVKHWRAKAVGYRDAIHDKEWFLDNPFVEDAGVLKSQLNSIVAEGGGDEPESLLDALHKVATMPATEKGAEPEARSWRYRSSAARVVVAFTDASYHAVMTEPKGGTFQDLVNVMTSHRIILSLFAPEMSCHGELGSIDKAEYHSIPDNLAEFTNDQANFKATMEMLAKSVSTSAQVEIL
jgi:hypothetical protein